MTDHYNAVRSALTVGGTGNVTAAATASGKARPLSTLPTGWQGGLRFDDPNGIDWELSRCTAMGSNVFSRDTVVAGSNGTSKVNLAVGSIALQTVLAEDLNAFVSSTSGVTLAAFLAATPGGAVSGTDALLGVQNNNPAGVTASALATFAASQYPANRTAAVRITAAATVPLDFTTHNRRRLIVTVAGVTISGPSNYATVADDFECEIINLSAAVVTLGTGISGIPSGNTIAVGGNARIFSTAGAIYASLGSAAAPDTVAPTATSAEVANATPTKVSITMSEAMDGAAGSTPAASAFTVGGHTVSAVAISGSVISLTVDAFVSGEAARTVAYTKPASNQARDLAQNQLASFSGLAITNNVAATGGGGGAPFTATNRAGFPIDRSSYNGKGDGNNFYTDIVPTGAVTAASVVFFVSESNSVRPSTGTKTTSPKGDSADAGLFGTSNPNLWQRGIVLNFNVTGNVLPLYFWIKITDSAGAVWWFRRTTTVNYLDNITQTYSTVTEAMVAA